MRLVLFKTLILAPIVAALLLSACFKPPYNNFEPATPIIIDETNGHYNPFNFFKSKKKLLLQKLANADIRYIEYGDTRTIIIPTDRYFEHESPRFNELCYKTLNDILMLLKFYPCSKIYIAAFTDKVGSKHHHDKLTQARAETMLTYLWANGFRSTGLSAEGYGHHYPVANNKLVHGAAQNRRMEIQWTNTMQNCRRPIPKNAYLMKE